jgi:hypothetical protein
VFNDLLKIRGVWFGRRATSMTTAALLLLLGAGIAPPRVSAVAAEPIGIECAEGVRRSCTSDGHVLFAGFVAEAGIAFNATFGTWWYTNQFSNTLTSERVQSFGFRPQSVFNDGLEEQGLGLVADRSRNGTWAAVDGDFFVPGAPFEAWGLQVDSTRGFNNEEEFDIQGDFVPGSLVDGSGGGVHRVRWESAGTFNGLKVAKTFRLPDGAQLVHVDVELTNTTGTRIDKIYYSRSIDPDNANSAAVDPEFSVRAGLPEDKDFTDGCWYCGENDAWLSINSVVSNPGGNTDLAEATAVFPGGASFSLLAKDSRARALVQVEGGIYERQGTVYVNYTPDLEALWNDTTGTVFTNVVGTEYFGDGAMHLIFNLGPLDPDEVAKFRFTYVLSDFDLQFARRGANPPDPRTRIPMPTSLPAFVLAPDGSTPSLPVESAAWQQADGTSVPLMVSSPTPGQVRYEADGVRLTLTGAAGTSTSRGLVANPNGEVECEICATVPPGGVIEVWMFSEPRLVAAHLVEPGPCQRFTIPVGTPLDGGDAVTAGAHTLQLALPTASGMQAVNVGVTIGGPVPGSIPAGEGPVLPAGLVGLVLLAAAGGVIAAGRRAVTA